jgi:2,3-bisphosphoglycerate-independent phosphoglycerate mutase
MPFAFEPERPATTLAQHVSDAGLKQYHCAETEKYAHVTYFFNGGRDQPFPGETRHLVPSPNVSTYDRSPEMSAAKVSDAVIAALNSRKYAFTVVNYANGDMVGHTARADAVIHAIECLDSQLNRVINSARENGYAIIVTADHGNCEELVAPGTGQPHTQHTTYPVPFIVIDREIWQLSCAGSLANVAPTVLQLMGLSQPASMTGKSLLLKSLGKADLESPVQGAA